MSYFEALVLGLVQGLTEFIPVSSSGHLVVFHEIFGAGANDLSIDAVLQLATVLAVLLYFRKEIFGLFKNFFKLLTNKPVEEGERNLLLAVILGTIPALIFGLVLESRMETAFRSSYLVAGALFFGSLLMFLADRKVRPKKTLTPVTGFFIGFFQSLALIPGVSRSGATISGGLFNGLSREDATRFSFILSFPIIFGSGLKKLFELSSTGDLFSPPLLLAFVVSFISGYFAIHYLLRYLRHHTLSAFIWYRVLLGLAIILLF